MSQRFFSPKPIVFDPNAPTLVCLESQEAHHFLHVMRGGVGDRLTLFDGSGQEFEAEVTETGRREITVTVLSSEAVDRESRATLTLGVAMPKGDRQKMLVEKLTELGVTRLVPLRTERSVAALKGSALDKLRRGVIEASKQCGRNVLMSIDEPSRYEDFLRETEAAAKLIAHPYDGSSASIGNAASIAVAIGPEGGFTDEEVTTAAAAGWGRLTIGRSILRIETAAIAAAALFNSERK